MTYRVNRMASVAAITVLLATLGCSNEQAATPVSRSPDSSLVVESNTDSVAESGTAGGGDRDAKTDTSQVDAAAQPSLEPHASIAPNSAQPPNLTKSTTPPTPTKAPKLTRSKLPEVKLSAGHKALCAVSTDDTMPPIALPDLAGNPQDLSAFYGENLTIVFFWKGDRALARTELADLEGDVVKRYGAKGVSVVGIAVEETAETAQRFVSEAGATYPNLLDADGNAMSLVGTEKLPRTYLLNVDGEVLWFDIEYSRTTRRELRKAIRAALRQIPQG